MSIWQFTAAVEGFAKAQAGQKNQMSAAEADELWDWIAGGDAIEAKPPLRAFEPGGAWPCVGWEWAV